MKTSYDIQAENFLQKTNTTLEIKFLKNDFYFDDDKEKRDIYQCTLKRGNRSYSFKFGQSINNSGYWYKYGVNKKYFELSENKKEYFTKYPGQLRSYVKTHFQFDLLPKDEIHVPVAPTAYNVLACIEKYIPEDFQDFCDNYGYDNDSISAKKIFKKVQKQALRINSLYNDEEMQELMEIE